MTMYTVRTVYLPANANGIYHPNRGDPTVRTTFVSTNFNFEVGEKHRNGRNGRNGKYTLNPGVSCYNT